MVRSIVFGWDRRWAGLAVLCSSLLLVSMDATVLHMAVPALSRDLGASSDAQLWIIAIYSLFAAPLLLAFGTLGDIFGRRRILVCGYGVFGIASVATALAPSVPSLIAARAVLGVGAAMIMPATLAVLRQLFPDRAERRVAIGAWSAIAGTGAVIGPLLGGLVVETLSWRAAFLINLPVLIAALPLTFWLIPESADPRAKKWDAIGATQATAGVLGVTFAIKQASHAPLIGLVAGVAGTAVLWAFVRRQRRIDTPLVDIRLFRRPAFAVAAGSVFLMMAILVGLGLLFAQYLQVVLKLSPVDAAYRLLFVVVAAVVASAGSAAILQRLGNRLVLLTGFAATSIALGAAAIWINVGENIWLLGTALTALGAAVALSLTAASDALLAAAPADQAGAVAAIEETGYELGAGVGVAVLGSLAVLWYGASLRSEPHLPLEAADRAGDGITAAANAATGMPQDLATLVIDTANASFVDGLRGTLAVCAVLAALASMTAAWLLPHDRPSTSESD